MVLFDHRKRKEVYHWLTVNTGHWCKCGRPVCRRYPNPGEQMEVDHKDGNRHHNCYYCNGNFQFLLTECNRIKFYRHDVKIIAASDPQGSDNQQSTPWLCVCGRKYDDKGQVVAMVRDGVEYPIEQSGSVKENGLLAPAFTSERYARVKIERDETKDSRGSPEVRHDDNWPRYEIMVLLHAQLSYPLKPSFLKNGLAALLNIPLGTIRNNYYPVVTAPEYGVLLIAGEAFRRNPQIELRDIEEIQISDIINAMLQVKGNEAAFRRSNGWQATEYIALQTWLIPEQLWEIIKNAPRFKYAGW